MKSFVVSIMLFLTMTAAIMLNSIYINNVTNNLTRMTESLQNDDDCTEEVAKIAEYWSENIDIISISVNFHETEAVAEAILSMIAYADSPASPEFRYAKSRFLETLSEISLGEKITISNIL